MRMMMMRGAGTFDGMSAGGADPHRPARAMDVSPPMVYFLWSPGWVGRRDHLHLRAGSGARFMGGGGETRAAPCRASEGAGGLRGLGAVGRGRGDPLRQVLAAVSRMLGHACWAMFRAQRCMRYYCPFIL